MAFLPHTKREKKILVILLLLLVYIGVEIKVGAKYAAKRDTEFRAFRWDSQTLWRLKSSYKGETFGQKVETNSTGLRGTREYSLVPSHALRIVTLGDSRTYGYAVGHEETYSAVLEASLRAWGVDAEVLNAGTHGYSAVQCRARLEQMLAYQPDLVVFAPGFNDRRYLVCRPEDSDASFRSIARLRSFSDILQISNVCFAIFFEIGSRKLAELTSHPPPLDQVPLRTSEIAFLRELEKTAQICRDHQVQLVYLWIPQDPRTYDFVETMRQLHENGDTREVIRRMETACNMLPNYARNLCRYYLGQYYLEIGEEKKARTVLADHRPSGSIFGESVLRSERIYLNLFKQAAEEYSVPMVDGREAIVGTLPEADAEDVFRRSFVDDCHYTAEAHRFIGAALAQQILSLHLEAKAN